MEAPAVQRLARPEAAASPKFATVKSDVQGKQKTLAAHPLPSRLLIASVTQPQAQGGEVRRETHHQAWPA